MIQLICSCPSSKISLLGISQYPSVWPRAVQLSIWRDVHGIWRPDYTPRNGIAALTAYLPRVGRSRSDCSRYVFPSPLIFIILTLPLADHVGRHHQAPPIYFDLRHHSFFPEHIHFVNLNRPHNGIDGDRPRTVRLPNQFVTLANLTSSVALVH